MKWCFILITLSSYIHLVHTFIDWWAWYWMTYGNRRKFQQYEAQIIEEMNRKILNIRDIRFMYEESPQYEIGYLIAEVMEKYRRMVDNVHRVNFIPDSIYMMLKYLQEQQTYYMEGYHLICMLHEIPRKYGHLPDFEKLLEAVLTGNSSLLDMTYEQQKERYESLAKQRKFIDRQKRKRLQRMKSAQAIDQIIRNAFGEGIDVGNLQDFLSPEKMRIPPKRPIQPPRKVTPKGRQYEYGWELNYEWWRK